MIFEGVDCSFSIVLAMIVRRDNLVFDITGCHVFFQNGGGFVKDCHEEKFPFLMAVIQVDFTGLKRD